MQQPVSYQQPEPPQQVPLYQQTQSPQPMYPTQTQYPLPGSYQTLHGSNRVHFASASPAMKSNAGPSSGASPHAYMLFCDKVMAVKGTERRVRCTLLIPVQCTERKPSRAQ
ncbi:hypothetical protein PC128_g23245 [Phytophthora cactorum]|nr:hypothetical protein PC128_g23245 [Phytophthora cactorum]